MAVKTYKIACLPGDGTGPEVINEGVKVLKAAAKKFGFAMKFDTYDWGGTRYVEQGTIMPDDAVETLKKYNAIYLGAIGRPDVAPGILEKGILLKLRFDLDQYINLRPVKLLKGAQCQRNQQRRGGYLCTLISKTEISETRIRLSLENKPATYIKAKVALTQSQLSVRYFGLNLICKEKMPGFVLEYVLGKGCINGRVF